MLRKKEIMQIKSIIPRRAGQYGQKIISVFVGLSADTQYISLYYLLFFLFE